MEFISYVEKVSDYFENTLPLYLDEMEEKYPDITIVDPSRYVNDYFDTDKYKEKIVLYITSDPEYTFEELSNESKAMNNSFDVYIVFRNDTEDNLKSVSKVYLEALYNMIKEDPSMGGNVDYAMVGTIRYYDGIEGQTSSKAIYIKITALKEV